MVGFLMSFTHGFKKLNPDITLPIPARSLGNICSLGGSTFQGITLQKRLGWKNTLRSHSRRWRAPKMMENSEIPGEFLLNMIMCGICLSNFWMFTLSSPKKNFPPVFVSKKRNFSNRKLIFYISWSWAKKGEILSMFPGSQVYMW